MKTIERLRELEKAATPVYEKPTELEHDTADGKRGDVRIWEKNIPGVCVAVFRNRKARATADHYIATRNALPALLALVEAQAAEIEAWRDLWDAMKKDRNGPNTQKLLKKLAAEEKTDAALRALEGGAG